MQICKKHIIADVFLLLILAMISAGCGSGAGSDSVSGKGPVSSVSSSSCLVCHSLQNSPDLDPLLTNGTGTAGKHVLHVSDRKIDCMKCHLTYPNQSTHMNGTRDTGNPAIHLVSFDATNPTGAWINDTGPATGNCSSLACHGPEVPDWYGGGSTLPDCTVCHIGALDPSTTNGSGTAGKHVLHVNDRGVGCLKCHLNYTNQATHMNGTKDTGNLSVRLVYFDTTNPTGAWINDTGPATGACSSLTCHGPQTPDWYGSSPTLPDCTVCHIGDLDPSNTNGSGTAGKHVLHVNDRGVGCLKCHLNYTNKTTHMNGTKDTGNSAARLVYFDTTNPTGAWINDTGPATGACSSLACHGPQIPDWYGSSSTLPDCTVCHIAALDPSNTNGSGTSGKHIVHVNDRSIGCLKCHLNYTAQATHMNGTKNTTDPAAHLVSFDSTNPTGAWINDTGPATGACSSLTCHGPQTPDWYGSGSALPACTTCHTGSYDPVNIDTSRAMGQHQIHSADYQFACQKCHFGYTGYPTHMNGMLDVSNFGVPLVFFDATNPLAQWINSTGSCSNTYCHSNGTSVSTNVLPANSSPPWYSTASGSCSLCHANTSYSDWRSSAPLYAQDQPKSNTHFLHIVTFTCNYCHFTTTHDGITISNPLSHANGIYNVDPDYNAIYSMPGQDIPVSFSYSYDPGGGVCSNISCHQARGIGATLPWGNASISINAAWRSTAQCWGIEFYNVNAFGGTAPYTYLWNFGDGTTSTAQNPTHVFPTGMSSVWVTVTARDAYRHPGSRRILVSPVCN